MADSAVEHTESPTGRRWLTGGLVVAGLAGAAVLFLDLLGRSAEQAVAVIVLGVAIWVIVAAVRFVTEMREQIVALRRQLDWVNRRTRRNARGVKRLTGRMDNHRNRISVAEKVSRQAQGEADVLAGTAYLTFGRQLSDADAETLVQTWGPRLGLKLSMREVRYLNRRIIDIEGMCDGRLATSVEDVLVRALVARAAAKDGAVRILEIGVLFGINSIFQHVTLSPFHRVKLTLLDPLEGYYGNDRPDIITGVPVTRRVLERNLGRWQVPGEDVEIVQGLSTDAGVRERMASQTFDVLLIDGDHTYAGVKADFDLYERTVRPGGFIIFDDYGSPSWPDVKAFVDSEVKPRAEWELIGASWCTAVFRRVG